ncbi:MAG: NYN domain-containing protein [Firmicutes bacterium]|nr:NYN domain-containing protein [Bacillota bacterium]
MRDGKTVWLIDAAYLFNAQESVSPDYNFDYRKLRDRLEQDGSIDRAYYLNSTPNPPTDAQSSFHSWLQTSRPDGPQFRVHLYQLKGRDYDCPHCHRKFSLQVQKGVDVGLATLIVRLAKYNYDNLILSSGDGDLKDAIVHAKEHCNKRFELCVFRWGVSPELQSYADKVHWIDDFATEVKK